VRSRATFLVQAPTKYEIVINFKTAKALGLVIQASLLAHAGRSQAQGIPRPWSPII